MLTIVNIYMELVHFITMFVFLSRFNCRDIPSYMVCVSALKIKRVTVYVVSGGRSYCGVHFVSMWQKK